MKKRGIVFTLLALVLGAQYVFAGTPLSYSHICEHREGNGEMGWLPGIIPLACKGDNFGDTHKAKNVFSEFVIDASKVTQEEKGEVERYMTNLSLLVKRLAVDFYKRKNSDREIPNEELSAWIDSVFAKIYQESFFSHYRYSRHNGEELKVLVGDLDLVTNRFRSVGMSQINSQAHDTKRTGKYFDVAQNILKGLEIFYVPWESAMTSRASCFKKNDPEDFINRARAAYSRYNGGAICRWSKMEERKKQWEKSFGCDFEQMSEVCRLYINFDTLQEKNIWEAANCKLTDAVAENNRECLNAIRKVPIGNFWRNDIGYLNQMETKKWEKYIKTPSISLPKDMTCVLDGLGLCMITKENRPKYLQGLLVRVTAQNEELKQNYCVIDEQNKANCVVDEAMIGCLNNFGEIKNYSNLVDLGDDTSSVDGIIWHLEKSKICYGEDKGFLKEGQFIRIKKNITIRREVNASDGYVAGTKPGEIYQILETVVRPTVEQDRYYKIQKKTTRGGLVEGYIYGGNADTWDKWTEKVDVKTLSEAEASNVIKIIPVAGDFIRVTEMALKNGKGLPVYSTQRYEEFEVKEDIIEETGGFLGFFKTSKSKTNTRMSKKVSPILDPLDSDEEITRLDLPGDYYVDKIYLRGEELRVYVRISLEDQQGFVYIGQLLPERTVEKYVEIRE